MMKLTGYDNRAGARVQPREALIAAGPDRSRL